MASSGGALAPAEVDRLIAEIISTGLTIEQVATAPLVAITQLGLNISHKRAALQKSSEREIQIPLGASNSVGSAEGRISIVAGRRSRATSALAASASAGIGTDFRDENTQIRETNFITRLLANKKINIFIQSLVFNVIAKAKAVGFPNEKIIECLKVKYVAGKSNIFIKNIGLKAEMAVLLVDLKDFPTFSVFCITNNITFMQLMGALFNFQINFELLALCIKASPKFQEIFMHGARKYLSLPPTLTFTEFTRKYLDEKGRLDVYYTIWYYFTTKIQNLFFINQHRALNNPRIDKAALIQSIDVPLFAIDQRLYKYNQLQDLLDLGAGQTATALAGNVFSAPGDNFWLDLQKDTEKEIISGPSGSACILFRFLFETTEVLPPTLPNMTMLLLAMSGHYSMLFHSLTEILQMYIECITTTLPGSLPEADHYNIAKNDVDYILSLVQKHLGDAGDLYTELTTGGISNNALNRVRTNTKLGKLGAGLVRLQTTPAAGLVRPRATIATGKAQLGVFKLQAANQAQLGSQRSAFVRPISNSNSNSSNASTSAAQRSAKEGRVNEKGTRKGGGRRRVHKRRTRCYH